MDKQVALHLELKVNDGQLETIKSVMAEMVESAEKEEGTLGYEWFISEDESMVHVFERYLDSDAAAVHGANVMPLLPKMISAVQVVKATAFGEPSDEYRQRMASMGAEWFGTLGGFVR
ncbi:MAG: hypothetical protein DCC49_05285 [Acidobacteria bacterium]|nr:MAG: hypothetical protein DCC49_05285 [Acidobacteriota bacterium]